MSLIDVQRRLREVGRIRLGDRGDRGQPQKLNKFRLTSGSKAVLDAAAAIYGGTVEEWKGAPNAGQYELYTDTDSLDVVIPPMPHVCSQFYESWSGGTCKRRCDGETEQISDGPCLCDADSRECKPTTRITVILPRIPGLGVWRLESHGWNAAVTLPGTVEMLAASGQYVRAILRLEQQSKKSVVDGKTMTKRFIVPVLDLPVTFDQLLGAPGAAVMQLPGTVDRREKVARPELPPPPDLPAEAPDWKRKQEPVTPAVSDLDTIMLELDGCDQSTVDAWLKANKKRVLALPVDEQDRVRVRVEELRNLPF